ncbi:hypothetical protein DNTS_021370 [Danionella cerebrum]|uniref:Uncharacterized protein n=1 Tax=Danionella cerebrum TaxID=2873325 RepID=A0A553N094_9TELE|nr:hypothetical protein DNTS_021370 [Danionella translucida]
MKCKLGTGNQKQQFDEKLTREHSSRSALRVLELPSDYSLISQREETRASEPVAACAVVSGHRQLNTRAPVDPHEYPVQVWSNHRDPSQYPNLQPSFHPSFPPRENYPQQNDSSFYRSPPQQRGPLRQDVPPSPTTPLRGPQFDTMIRGGYRNPSPERYAQRSKLTHPLYSKVFAQMDQAHSASLRFTALSIYYNFTPLLFWHLQRFLWTSSSTITRSRRLFHFLSSYQSNGACKHQSSCFPSGRSSMPYPLLTQTYCAESRGMARKQEQIKTRERKRRVSAGGCAEQFILDLRTQGVKGYQGICIYSMSGTYVQGHCYKTCGVAYAIKEWSHRVQRGFIKSIVPFGEACLDTMRKDKAWMELVSVGFFESFPGYEVLGSNFRQGDGRPGSTSKMSRAESNDPTRENADRECVDHGDEKALWELDGFVDNEKYSFLQHYSSGSTPGQRFSCSDNHAGCGCRWHAAATEPIALTRPTSCQFISCLPQLGCFSSRFDVAREPMPLPAVEHYLAPGLA